MYELNDTLRFAKAGAGFAGLSEEAANNLAKLTKDQLRSIFTFLTAGKLQNFPTYMAAFNAKFLELPYDILCGLAAGDLQVSRMPLYWVKDMSLQSSMEMIKESDNRNTGVTNISNAKLEENKYFLLCGIQFLQGTFIPPVSDAALAASTYAAMTDNALINGEFEIRVNNADIVRYSPMISFSSLNENFSQSPSTGFMLMDNAKWLPPQKKLEFNFTCPIGATVGANTSARLTWDGMIILPNTRTR